MKALTDGDTITLVPIRNSKPISSTYVRPVQSKKGRRYEARHRDYSTGVEIRCQRADVVEAARCAREKSRS